MVIKFLRRLNYHIQTKIYACVRKNRSAVYRDLNFVGVCVFLNDYLL